MMTVGGWHRKRREAGKGSVRSHVRPRNHMQILQEHLAISRRRNFLLYPITHFSSKTNHCIVRLEKWRRAF